MQTTQFTHKQKVSICESYISDFRMVWTTDIFKSYFHPQRELISDPASEGKVDLIEKPSEMEGMALTQTWIENDIRLFE